MSDINSILKEITKAVDSISTAAKDKQPALYKQILSLIKELETNGDQLLNNLSNLKKISLLKAKLQKVLLDDKFKDASKDFLNAYKQIAELSNAYFASFNLKFSPAARLKAFTTNAILTTSEGLLGAGLDINVVDKIKEVLFENIHVGGSYADMTEKLRTLISGDEKTEGVLHGHVKTYAITAINQFSAGYNQEITEDLNLSWYVYTGSLKTTSRPFCIKAVDKQYIHVSEFATILHGDFGKYGKVHLNKKTGLPDGLMEGTKPENFPRRRGGWECGHQLIAVDEMIVPAAVKDEVYNSSEFKIWGVNNPGKLKNLRLD